MKRSKKSTVGNDVPVKPYRETWHHHENPDFIRKAFDFKSPKQLVFFLEDVIQMESQVKHHGKLLIEGLTVLAQISTKVYNKVTELDTEWAAEVDAIYDNLKDTK